MLGNRRVVRDCGALLMLRYFGAEKGRKSPGSDGKGCPQGSRLCTWKAALEAAFRATHFILGIHLLSHFFGPLSQTWTVMVISQMHSKRVARRTPSRSCWQEGRGERQQPGPVLLSETRGGDTSSDLLFDLRKFKLVTLFNLLSRVLYGFCQLHLVTPTPAQLCEQPVGLGTGAQPCSCHPALQVCILWHTAWPLR